MEKINLEAAWEEQCPAFPGPLEASKMTPSIGLQQPERPQATSAVK